jgi:hypothetical protein
MYVVVMLNAACSSRPTRTRLLIASMNFDALDSMPYLCYVRGTQIPSRGVPVVEEMPRDPVQFTHLDVYIRSKCV